METITLQINGKPESVISEITLKKFLETKGIDPNLVACELNLKIVRRADLDKMQLKEGDTLEIIRIIGGG